MTADEPAAGVPRLCARRADCTRPRGHDDECGPDRDQARVARYAAALSSARLDAVLAVADTELVDLRAEVERLRAAMNHPADDPECVASPCQYHEVEAERDALQRQVDAIRARRDEWHAGLSETLGHVIEHWRGHDYAEGFDAAMESVVESLDVALDAVEPADQPHPTPEADEVQYEVAARFQDGEVFTPEQMARGLGVFDEEAPVLVARRVGDDEWLTLGSGGGFIHEYEVWDDSDDEAGS